MYTERELVAVAKRENNNKRSYLVVNRLQGKHIPVDPSAAFGMFSGLASKLEEKYEGQSLLVVGFAETATAIGAAVAAELGCLYIQTTREDMGEVSYFHFTESHSHASEQKLVKDDLDLILGRTDRVIFVEDEVTTGNTILNLVDVMEKACPDRISFSVASLLNGMEEESLAKYQSRGIALHYLVKTDHRGYPQAAQRAMGDGHYHKAVTGRPQSMPLTYNVQGNVNARRCIRGADYQSACERVWEQAGMLKLAEGCKRILVIGTEEFMYPALYTARRFQEAGLEVKCHSTTRSPIAVSMEPDYPLHERFELVSLYESGRRTFIYDLEAYDLALVMTDAAETEGEGACSLIHALQSRGNENIVLVRWCEG